VTSRRPAPPWPAESRQEVYDYLDRIRWQDPARRWQEDTPVAPCAGCSSARQFGRLCRCGTITPPALPPRCTAPLETR